jgi:hypothetical protein
MTTPIYNKLSLSFELLKKTARIESRMELAADLRKIPKPTKQVVDLIKKLETNEDAN